MRIITIILLAVGLAMDAFAVSISSGVVLKNIKLGSAVKIAFFFGIFQALMPVIGWLAGLSIHSFISDVDHWVAFGLLSVIGLRMIYVSLKESDGKNGIDPLNIHVLLVLSVATSIDALAVGISFAFLHVSIITPVIVIGIITFFLSFIGVFIGNKVGQLFSKKIEIIGGIILISIGIKILVEHLR